MRPDGRVSADRPAARAASVPVLLQFPQQKIELRRRRTAPEVVLLKRRAVPEAMLPKISKVGQINSAVNKESIFSYNTR